MVLYVLDLGKYIYRIESKSPRINDHSATDIKHCCLARISTRRIEKLHKDEVPKSNDYKPLDVCKRDAKLFGLIHTNVCKNQNLLKTSKNS